MILVTQKAKPNREDHLNHFTQLQSNKDNESEQTDLANVVLMGLV